LLHVGFVQVSILVVVDDAHRLDDVNRPIETLVEFQSLLSWMTLTGTSFTSVVETRLRVSILVVVDDAHRLLARAALIIQGLKLQSLLSWMTLTGPIA